MNEEKIKNNYKQLGSLFAIFGATLFVGLYILFTFAMFTDVQDNNLYFIILGIQHIAVVLVLIVLLTRIYSQKSEIQHEDFEKFSLSFTSGIVLYLLSFIVFWIGYYFIKNSFASDITALVQEGLLIGALVLQIIAWIRFHKYSPLDPSLSVKRENKVTFIRSVQFMIVAVSIFSLVTITYFVIDLLNLFGVLTTDYSELRIYIDLVGVSLYGLAYISIGLSLRGEDTSLGSNLGGTMTNVCEGCGAEIPSDRTYCMDCEKIRSDHP